MISFTQTLRWAAAAAFLAYFVPSIGWTQSAPQKTLRFIPQADLRSIDPIWTTAYVTRNFGYLVFDTLFALDKDFKPQPQMVDRWTASDDKLSYSFVLRDGLKWHDGQPVRAADCIASVERWGKRDTLGQKLMEAVGEMQAVDDKTFTIKLKSPFPLILDALGKLSSNVPFMMPERLAKTDAYQQIPEAIGSGPFKFVKEEWEPGHKAVFVKNADYVPREEAPSFASGGKVAKVDRVEWLYIPDTSTAAAALNAGEADWYEQPPADLVPVFAASKDITVTTVDPLGNHGILRFNHVQPPFNNLKLRQAVLNLVDQKDYMGAAAGDPKYWKTCVALFGCGTPFETNAGAAALLNEKGCWSIFHTWTSAPDFFSPAVNLPIRANGEKAWFGWPTDPKIEELIDAWFKAPDLAAQKKLAADIQVEAYTNDVPYVPTGQFVAPTAYRRTSRESSSRRSSFCGTSKRSDRPSNTVTPAEAGAQSLPPCFRQGQTLA